MLGSCSWSVFFINELMIARFNKDISKNNIPYLFYSIVIFSLPLEEMLTSNETCFENGEKWYPTVDLIVSQDSATCVWALINSFTLLLTTTNTSRACHKPWLSPTCTCQKQVDPQFKHFSWDIVFKHFSRPVRTLSFVLHFYSERSVYLQSFKLIPFIVLKPCRGQGQSLQNKRRHGYGSFDCTST